MSKYFGSTPGLTKHQAGSRLKLLVKIISSWQKSTLARKELGFFSVLTQYRYYNINYLPASGKFCHLLITFANSLDPDQTQHSVGAWSGSKVFGTLVLFLKEYFEKKNLENTCRWQKIRKSYQACRDINGDLNMEIRNSKLSSNSFLKLWAPLNPFHASLREAYSQLFVSPSILCYFLQT